MKFITGRTLHTLAVVILIDLSFLTAAAESTFLATGGKGSGLTERGLM